VDGPVAATASAYPRAPKGHLGARQAPARPGLAAGGCLESGKDLLPPRNLLCSGRSMADKFYT